MYERRRQKKKTLIIHKTNRLNFMLNNSLAFNTFKRLIFSRQQLKEYLWPIELHTASSYFRKFNTILKIKRKYNILKGYPASLMLLYIFVTYRNHLCCLAKTSGFLQSVL